VTNGHFASRLQSLREAAGLSQYELAKKAGVTRQTLSRLEMGESAPTWPTVQLLAIALGVDCSAFVDPGLQPPEEEPTRPRGRPRKDAPAATTEPAPKKGKGKNRKGAS
jgi:transcriptional regulator with XRE-family HTH domain